MTGIDVGTSRITVLRGAGRSGIDAPRAAETIERVACAGAPEDLLLRIADGAPYVRLRDGECELVSVHDLYARAVVDALRGSTTDAPDISGIPDVRDDAGARADTGALDNTAAQGRPDEEPAVAVPAWWPRRAVLETSRALERAGIFAVLIDEAAAAVAEYRAGRHDASAAASPLPLPDAMAVVTLRAGATSAAVVRGCAEASPALERPALVRAEGGRRLDRAVLRHLMRGLEEAGCTVDASDPRTAAAVGDLLVRSRALRESLSVAVAEAILPGIPGCDRKVLLARAELEALADPWVGSVVELLGTALERTESTVDTVLLTGGLAAMPLVAQRISADLGLEVLVPDEPELVAVRGAERLRLERAEVEAAAIDAARARPALGGFWAAFRRSLVRGGSRAMPAREAVVLR